MAKIDFYRHIPFFSSSPKPENGPVSQTRSPSDIPKAENPAPQIPQRKSAQQTALLAQLAGESGSNKNTEAKAQLVDGLQKIRHHFATLSAKNWSPGSMDDYCDEAMLPLLIAAENKRSPKLNLTQLPPDKSFGEWLENWQTKPKWYEKATPASARVMFVVPGFMVHHVVADIKRDQKGNVSVLLIEPLGFKGEAKKTYEANALPKLQKELGGKALNGKVTLTVLALDTQKSDNDCRIFGLSAASKIADEPALFNVLHTQNLAGEFKTAKGEKAKTLAGKESIKIIDGKGILPPSFFKHSQSKTTLKKWLGQNPPAFANASVNKSGQSLIGRFERDKTVRYKNPMRLQIMHMFQPDTKLHLKEQELRMSASIEKKRLTYIDRALDYLSNASEREAKAFMTHFDDTIRMGGGLPNPEEPKHLERRKLGPHPDKL